ncbi:MAG TPA: polyprenyl synthetase family protein [Anaerolineales bacterium]|nr:polyprenyl synthetase family protein [Anaerolineales bacterium]
MPSNKLESVYPLIKLIWEESGAWADFLESMRQALPDPYKRADPERDPARFALLPGLCCQAAGGEPGWAADLAAAWLLYYTAAHVFDGVEDQDQPEAWWAASGPGVAINVATGLLFSAFLGLQRLYKHKQTRQVAQQVIQDFNQSLLVMASGQHADLVNPQPDLEQWLEIAGAKSGELFALACRCGARLATNDPARLKGFSDFGHHLGILLQILDDLEDLKPGSGVETPDLSPKVSRSLVVAYALDVLPSPAQKTLKECLLSLPGDQEAAGKLIQLIDQSGAALYLRTEIERQLGLGLTALEEAAPDTLVGGILTSMLRELAKDQAG